MIYLIGHRASGKTTVGKILESQNFWFFDIGPFWRGVTKSTPTKLSPEEYILKIKEQTEDQYWEHNFLARELINLHKTQMHSKKDIAISGFRSVEDLNQLRSRVKEIFFPLHPHTIIFLKCNIEDAWTRYKEREGYSASYEKLTEQYEYEIKWGLNDLEREANYIVDNSGSLKYLNLKIEEILYKRLKYGQ